MEVSARMPCARSRYSIVLSYLLPILFVMPWASPEPAQAAPVPQASVQSGLASSANPPAGELTPPPKSLVITPSAIGIVEGEPQLLRLSDDRGRRVREAVWTVSDPTQADIKVDGDATITGLAPGKLTVTATWRGLTAQARVTVLHSPSLYQGTAQMPEYPGGRPTAPIPTPGSVSTAQMPDGRGRRPTVPIPARDQRGRINRSSAAKREFMRRTGYLHGRPAYVVDHIIPLACGGSDDPSNMQWQTLAEARAKDGVERRACR